MTINELIKEFKRTFNNLEFRATSKDGQVFKSIGFDNVNNKIKKKIDKQF